MKNWLFALGLLVPGIALATINVNTATKDELVALPGVGPAKAQAILDHRKAHGPFKSVDELKDVKGIGAKRFEKIKGELTIAGPNSGVRTVAKADPAPARPTRADTGAAARRDGTSAKP
ncbi:MAG: helix-hairpin-helix domain-containing protein [Betaproteobacteria bacterium]